MAPSTCGGNAKIAAVAMILLLVAAMVATAAGDLDDARGAAASAAAGVSCGDAVSALIPCGPFLVGADAGAAGPSERCCRGAQALRRMARTAGARRALCRCLEESGPSFGVLPDRARQLPARCKLGVAIPVSPHADCDRVP